MKALARTLGLVSFVATAAQASDIKLPAKISWAVHSESAGAEAAAIGAARQELLAAAWQQLKQENPADWMKAWTARRGRY